MALQVSLTVQEVIQKIESDLRFLDRIKVNRRPYSNGIIAETGFVKESVRRPPPDPEDLQGMLDELQDPDSFIEAFSIRNRIVNPFTEIARTKNLRLMSRSLTFDIFSMFQKVEILDQIVDNRSTLPIEFRPLEVVRDPLDPSVIISIKGRLVGFRFLEESDHEKGPIDGRGQQYYRIIGVADEYWLGRFESLYDTTTAWTGQQDTMFEGESGTGLPGMLQTVGENGFLGGTNFTLAELNQLIIDGDPNAIIGQPGEWMMNPLTGVYFEWDADEGLWGVLAIGPNVHPMMDTTNTPIGTIIQAPNPNIPTEDAFFRLQLVTIGGIQTPWWVMDNNLVDIFNPFTLNEVNEETIADAVEKGWLQPWDWKWRTEDQLISDPPHDVIVFQPAPETTTKDELVEFGFNNFYLCLMTGAYESPDEDNTVYITSSVDRDVVMGVVWEVLEDEDLPFVRYDRNTED